MIRELTNRSIPASTWMQMGTRNALRAVAKEHGITRGRDKKDTAFYLSQGVPYPLQRCSFGPGCIIKPVTFPITITLS